MPRNSEQPLSFNPELYYDEEGLRICHRFDSQSLQRAREAGELRYKLVGTRILYKGEWLLAWLDQPHQPHPRNARVPA